MRYTKVNLCRIEGKSCFGCCGHHFGTRNEILESIRKNDISFAHKKTLRDFMKENSLRDSGVCRCIVTLKDGTLGCPGHPKQCRRELRACNILYECKTSFLFRTEWSDEEKKRFLSRIKDMDGIGYSLLMSEDKYLNSL